ncbi:hypothetical protein HOK00_00690 [bacterium]|nr:hypothetical protein [bacterium]
MKKNIIVKKNDREHALLRPGRYISNIKPEINNLFLYSNGVIQYEEVTYVEGLIKIIREVIDNSIDEAIRTNFKFANKIKVDIEANGSITIEDNGRGIPYSKDEEGHTSAELAWCHLKAGSNFDDEVDNTTVGQNGEGVCLTHIFSKSFLGETCDGSKKTTVSSNNNMDNIKTKTITGKKKFTRVSFTPDYQRFSLEGLDEAHLKIIYTDLLNLSLAYPKIKFIYNSKDIENMSFDKYLNMINNKENYESFEVEGLKFAIIENSSDDFNFIHNINGINAYEGGSPLTWLLNNISNKLKDRLAKSCKNIKVGDIKNKITLVAFFNGMRNPRFSNQSKTKCINTYTDFKDTVGDINFVKIAEKIRKNKSITNSIVLNYKIIEEFGQKKILESLKPVSNKRFFIEKYLPPTDNHKYLVISEGDSANGSISPVLGRKDFGYFPLKGKPLNVLEVTNVKISSNEEIKNIFQIINLDVTKDKQKLKYENILIATDADADGVHILGLILNLFNKFAKDLILNGNIKMLRTPIIVAKKKNEIFKDFYSLNEYHNFINNNSSTGLTFQYYKGLGTWIASDLRKLIKSKGIDNFIVPFTIENEEDLDEIMELWFSKDKSDLRKDEIIDNSFDINGAL